MPSVVPLDRCAAEGLDHARAVATRPAVLGSEESARIADVFDMLSDPNRVRVLFTLLEVEEACVCDLAEMVGMTQSALSHALRLLRTAGVVANRRHGRTVHYRLSDGHVRLLLDVTRQHLDHDQLDHDHLDHDHLDRTD